MDAFEIDNLIEKELETLKQEHISDKLKVKIKLFVQELQLKGPSKYRQYIYLHRLRLIVRILDDSMLNISEEDVKTLIRNSSSFR